MERKAKVDGMLHLPVMYRLWVLFVANEAAYFTLNLPTCASSPPSRYLALVQHDCQLNEMHTGLHGPTICQEG